MTPVGDGSKRPSSLDGRRPWQAKEFLSNLYGCIGRNLSEPGSSPCIRREPPTMTIAYTTDRAVPGASVGGARHAGFGWVVRGQANSSPRPRASPRSLSS